MTIEEAKLKLMSIDTLEDKDLYNAICVAIEALEKQAVVVKYKMQNDKLFGKRCIIPTGYNKRPFVYRILRSGVMSNAWSEIPITYNSETEHAWHDYFEDILYVVCDTLIDEHSRIIRVAEKDVKIME